MARLSDMTYEKGEPDTNGDSSNTISGIEEAPVSKKHKAEENGEVNESDAKEIAKEEPKDKDETTESMSEPTEEGDNINDVVSKELEEVALALAKIVGEANATKATAMLGYWSSLDAGEKGQEGKEKNVIFPIIDDKNQRKEVHMLIRGPILSKHAVADTIDKRVRIWHNRFEKDMPNYGDFAPGGGRGGKGSGSSANRNNKGDNKNDNKRKREAWPMGQPNFLQFVLYKENVDTITACKDVCRAAHLPLKGKGGVTYAGMKDKRGVTSQFCTVYRRTAAEIAAVNSRKPFNSHHNQGGGGNTSSGSIDVVKAGNFRYVDRECNLGTLGGNRFDIVLRNVDPGLMEETESDKEQSQSRMDQAKALAESAAAAMKESGFVNYFGMQRFGKYFDTHLVGIEMLKNNFEDAVEIIMQLKPDEQARTISARQKWKDRFDGIGETEQQSRRKAEQSCANNVKRDLARFMTSEQRMMDHLARRPLDYRGAILSLPTGMMLMFLHSLQSFVWNKTVSHRIEQNKKVIVGDLVLVENRTLEEGGSGTSGLKGKAVAVVTDDDVKSNKYAMTDVMLPLPGRKIQFPTNESGEYMKSILADLGLSMEDFKHQCKELTLGGDYRKILCHPNDFEYRMIRYKDPVQPLEPTDLMKCSGEELSSKGDEGDLLGMVVGFTLPPSSYATIALRELTRRPTAGQYQKDLQLEGPCEKNIHQLKPPSVPVSSAAPKTTSDGEKAPVVEPEKDSLESENKAPVVEPEKDSLESEEKAPVVEPEKDSLESEEKAPVVEPEKDSLESEHKA
jgi:tRNA pseudouridine13 synthase